MSRPGAWAGAAAAVVLAATAALPAWAGSVAVRVTDAEGRPAADVVVLVQPAASAAATAATAAAAAAAIAQGATIAQQGLRFAPFLTVVPVGATVRFTNRDTFDHHVRAVPSGPLGAQAPAVNFELRLGAAGEGGTARPGTAAEVLMNKPGPVGLGCHLHGSMRGQLYVSPTPWFGKTDAQGTVLVENVPDGEATVRLWHADQLTEQPVLTTRVGAGAAPLLVPLNFTPRRRRG